MYFYLKEPSAEKETPIYIIYYVKNDDENFKRSTSLKILPSEWNSNNRYPKAIRGKKGVHAKHIASALEPYKRWLEAAIREHEEQNTSLTKAFLEDSFDANFKNKKPTPISIYLTDGINDFINSKKKSGGASESWVKKYSNLRNKLTLFEIHKNRRIKFADVNNDWLLELAGFLRSFNVDSYNKEQINAVNEINKRGYKPLNDNSLYRFNKFLFTFLRWSEEKYHTINLSKLENPASDYEPDDVYIEESELKLLEELSLESALLTKTLDIFLIGIYSGQRFSDYSIFEKEDFLNGMIIKKSEKTEKESFIPVTKKLEVLLNKYDWKLPRVVESKFNKRIKEVCKIAGIDKIEKEVIYRGNKKIILKKPKYEMVSSHTARRTFITISSERGMPDHIIMKSTGIKDARSLKKYKKTTQKSVIDSMNKIWS